MVESIASISLLGHRPLCGGLGLSWKEVSYKRKQSDVCRLMEFTCRRISSSPNLLRRGGEKVGVFPIKALAMELTKEVHSYREQERIPRGLRYPIDTGIDRKPGLWPPENKADNSSLHNPLLRHQMMGCGWLGAIFEWEGVIIEDNTDIEKQAWLVLSEEEGQSPPPAFLLRRIEGMKSEQAISEVLCWSRDRTQVRRMASRKEEIYQGLQGGMYRLRDGSLDFVNVLMKYKVPMALVSTRPRKTLETAIRAIGIESCFSVIVAAEDVYRGKPDPEMFVYAAQLLNFIPERCIVFGNSTQTVEAAHDARMKCVAVASKHPVYELRAADLVVRHLDELSMVDLKKLGATETEPEVEMEPELDYPSASTAVAVDNGFW